MKPCNRIIFQAADGSEYYPVPWDGTTAVALLPGGACVVRQDGNAYAFQASTTAPTITAAPVMVTVDPTAALAALQTAVGLAPQATDVNASVAALKTSLGAIMTAVLKLPDPTAALAALLAKLSPAASGDPGVIAFRDGNGGTLVPTYYQTDPNGKAPTMTNDGAPMTQVSAVWVIAG